MTREKSQATIDELIADRARYESWLDQLAAKAGQIPEHVVARVRDDYTARLTQVVESLTARSDELRSQCQSFESRIAELDGDLRARRDARAEDELRAMVGEYSDDDWNARRATHDEGIAALESERADRERDLGRVRELLNQATRPSRAIAVVEEAGIPEEPTQPEEQSAAGGEQDASAIEALFEEPPAGVLDEPAPANTTQAEPAAPAGEPAAPEAPKERKPSPFDEIEFLKTVVGRATPLGAARVSTEVSTNSAAPANALTDAPPATEKSPARATIPTFKPPELDGSLGAPKAETLPEPAPEPTFGDAPVFRTSGANEGARSLKCQECGCMNFPTEWYCEKCGGELAAF